MILLRWHSGIIVALLAIGLLAACKDRKIIPGEPPIKEVEFHKNGITVTALPGTHLLLLVELNLFGPFRPHMNIIDTVRQNRRSPDNERKEGHSTYYEFWEERSRVELVRYEATDQVDWVLYSYPHDLPFTAVLIPEISRHINPAAEETRVTIKIQDVGLSMFVDIKGSRVDHMIWFQ